MYQLYIWKHACFKKIDVPSATEFGYEKGEVDLLVQKMMTMSAAASELLNLVVCD